MTAYQKRLTSDDEALSLEAARRWSVWETSTSQLFQNAEEIQKAQTDDRWARYVYLNIELPMGRIALSC
jgi:proline iminopeptidase